MYCIIDKNLECTARVNCVTILCACVKTNYLFMLFFCYQTCIVLFYSFSHSYQINNNISFFPRQLSIDDRRFVSGIGVFNIALNNFIVRRAFDSAVESCEI